MHTQVMVGPDKIAVFELGSSHQQGIHVLYT